MNWIFKNKNKRAKTLLVVLFLAIGFSFFSFEDVKAAGTCESGSTEKTCECFNGSASLSFFPAGHNISDFNAQLTTGFCHQESCMQYCMFKFPATTAVKYDGGTFGTSSIKNSSSAVISAPSLSEQVCGGTLSMFNPSTWLQCALIMVLQLVGYLFAIAATLFAWAIDPSNVSGPNGILEKQAIKDVWIMVRDLLNMTFILILLFSAFCTIFQIDNWGLKKVWLNILINALLVNFSFPIARFIIDISNVTFYYFVKHLFASTGTSTVTGSTIFSSFASTSGIGDLLQPEKYADHAIPYLIASIIFVFIFGMTLLIIGALFIVRLVALAMLIMFSPIGFVGYIFPESASYANKWWKNLFSYSFFAPIMIFVMAISLRIMQALQAENMSSMQAISGVNAVSDQQGWVANAAFYTIPIIILWGGMGIAKSSGIAGADTVVGGVKKWGTKIANSPLTLGKYAWKQSGVPGGFKKGMENARKNGKLFGSEKLAWALKDNREEREARITGGIGGGKKGWNEAMEKKNAEEFRKKYKEEADKHDRVEAIGAGGITDRILRADLHSDDANSRGKAAMDVASLLHALKTDSNKKDEFELRITERALAMPGVRAMSDTDRDLHVKKEIAKSWKLLNRKGAQAHYVATKGEKPTDSTTGAVEPEINIANARAAGEHDTWS